MTGLKGNSEPFPRGEAEGNIEVEGKHGHFSVNQY